MSSDEKQQHDDHKIHIGLSTFNSRVVQTVVLVNKFTSLVEPIERLLSTANRLEQIGIFFIFNVLFIFV